MTDNTRIKRSTYWMKGFMVLVALLPALQYIQTGNVAANDVVAVLACLSWMQALLLSPHKLHEKLNPQLKHSASHDFSPASKIYFQIGVVLLLCSGLF